MKFIPIVFANLLKRHRLRTALTILSIVVAFILFSYLVAIKKAFEMGVDVAGADRLVVRHKVSLIQLLPQSYEADIERIEGVDQATHFTWFGGIYQDPKNFFAQMPVKPDELFDIYPEFVVSDEEKEAFRNTMTGAIVGRKIADKFGWDVGDRIPLQATIWTKEDGGLTWELDIVGIYEGAEEGTDTTQMFFRHDYLDENRQFGEGQVGWYVIRVSDPDQAEAVAKKIDEEFANSPAETKTETEGAFVQAFADQVGNIGAIVIGVLSAVFFTILLVAGNTMAQAVRERTSELGVLKAVGFPDGGVLALVLIESCVISIIGGGLGLGLGVLMVSQGDPTGGMLPLFRFPEDDLVVGIILVLVMGIVTGILPAIQALRLDPVTALRRE